MSAGGGPIGGGGGGGTSQTQTSTDREYVWAPPPSGYVDECVCQIDRNNAVRYVIQDASYDVVAIVAPQTSGGNPQPSKVIAQYTWDPYGQVLTAEYSGLASTYNKLGHHGLFADRLDAGYTQPTLLPGFVSSTHLPARIVYQVRNRTYDPSTQRWLQRDPNATGQVVLGSLASGGQAMSGAVSAIELATLYGDGMSLYGYVGNGPVQSNDPSGMLFDLLGPSSTLEFETDRMQDVLEAGGRLAYFVANSLDQYSGDMEAMADWASDLTLKDDMFSQPEGADASGGYGYPSPDSSGFAYGGKASSGAKKGISIIKGGERARIGKLGSYAEMARETEGFGGKIQAHHLIEKRYTKGGRALAGRNPNNFPAVILTRKQHQMYSANLQREFYALRRRRGNDGLGDIHEIRAIYERVYAGKPDWLDRVIGYLE